MSSVHKQGYQAMLDWLISQRQLAGLTQAQLAENLCKPQSYVSKYEHGERRIDLTEVIDICKALDVNPQELLNHVIRQCK